MKETIGNGNKPVDVNVQSQTSPYFQYFLIHEQKTDITLTSAITKDDEVINVSVDHGFTAVAGEFIVIWENNRYIQMRVTSVTDNAISISHPVSNSFTVAGAKIIRGNNLLNIDGSTSPANFIMRIQDFTIPIDISKIILTLTHSVVQDDGKFGGIAALTKGLWFRKEDGIDFNLGNYTDNQSFKTYGASVEYTDKAPAGEYSTNVTIDLEKVFGQVIRIDAREDGVFFSQVRDDLEDLSKFEISLLGSYTKGE